MEESAAEARLKNQRLDELHKLAVQEQLVRPLPSPATRPARVGRAARAHARRGAGAQRLQAELNAKEEWRVALGVGFPHSAAPGDVVDAFKALRHANISLEAEVAALREREAGGSMRASTAEGDLAAARAAAAAAAREEAALQFQSDLMLERATVKRHEDALADMEQQLLSIKREQARSRSYCC